MAQGRIFLCHTSDSSAIPPSHALPTRILPSLRALHSARLRNLSAPAVKGLTETTAQNWAVPREAGFSVAPRFHPEREAISVFTGAVLPAPSLSPDGRCAL